MAAALRSTCIALAAGAVLACRPASPPVQDSYPAIVFSGARIYPSPADEPIDDGIIVVRNGHVAEVGRRRDLRRPAGATVVECAGLVLTAGFWNSHVHFTERRWEDAGSAAAETLSAHLRQMLVRHGFTSVVDTGSHWPVTAALRRRIDAGEVIGPRILTTGEIMFPKGGAPPSDVLDRIDYIAGDMPEIGNAEEAAELARRKLAGGADAVKLYVATWWNDPPVRLDPALVRAVAAEAHRRQKPVLAHPSDLQGIEAALSGGADVLLHTTPAAGPWPAALVSRMREDRIALVPTLTLWRVELLRAGVPEADALALQRSAVEQLRAYVAAGGEVLFGTDVGYMQETDPGEEYELMRQAGMSYRKILAALTTAPAARFGGGTRSGRIVAGEPADFVALLSDPATDHAAFGRIARVVRGGRIVHVEDDPPIP